MQKLQIEQKPVWCSIPIVGFIDAGDEVMMTSIEYANGLVRPMINGGLRVIGQLFKTDLGLSVHWVLTLGLYFWLPLYSEKCTMIIVYSYRFLPLLCLSFGSNKSIAIPLAICSPT